MTDKERMAIAILKAGRSWKEASDATQIPVDRLQALWRDVVEHA